MLDEHEIEISGLKQLEDIKLLEPKSLELPSFKLDEKLSRWEPELQ